MVSIYSVFLCFSPKYNLFSELEEVTKRTKEKVNAGLLHKVLLEVVCVVH